MVDLEAKMTIKQYLKAILNSNPMEITDIKKVLYDKYGVTPNHDTIRGRLAELRKEGFAVSKKGKYKFQVFWQATPDKNGEVK